jgi:hypothetical protein
MELAQSKRTNKTEEYVPFYYDPIMGLKFFEFKRPSNRKERRQGLRQEWEKKHGTLKRCYK